MGRGRGIISVNTSTASHQQLRSSRPAPPRSLGEGVDAGCSGPFDVTEVARREGEAVNTRGRGEETIDHGGATDRTEPSPLLRDGAIHGKNAVSMVMREPSEPPFERSGLAGIALPDGLDTASDLPDDQHAEPEIFVGDRREPYRDTGIAMPSLAEFGQDVGVEQIAHRRTRRGRRRLRSKSSSVPTLGMRESHSLKLVRPRPGRSAALKISRCTASMERPLRAARALRAETVCGSRLRTIS
jgi:hypothetical protein